MPGMRLPIEGFFQLDFTGLDDASISLDTAVKTAETGYIQR